jgi:hypothetical protein
MIEQTIINEFIETYCGAFPDVEGRKPWKTWDELREAMRKDIIKIAEREFHAGTRSTKPTIILTD